MSIKVQVRINQASLEQAKEKALNIAAQRVIRGFDTTVGPHLLKVARSKAPVGKRETKTPQRSSFVKVRLAPLGTFGSAAFSKKEAALVGLHGLGIRGRAAFVRKAGPAANEFFRGSARGPNRDRAPDQVRVMGGTVKGAFIHKPGTLRDSHVYIPARRVRTDKVIAEVRATAEYAAAQHEGFNHHAHGKPTGTKVAGRKWLNESLVNVASDQRSPSTYKG